MQNGLKKLCFTVLAAAAFAPVTLLAQEDKSKDDKDVKEKKEVEQITIIRKGDNKDKLVVEVTGDKILVNGKEVKEDADGDLTVSRHRIKDIWNYGGGRAYAPSRNVFMNSMDENRAMLGVSTEKADEGAEITNVSKESAAEKAGLKDGDVITKVGDKKIDHPDDLSNAIKAHKPGDKVTVTYLRDKKENKVTAELTKWKGASVFFSPDAQNFNFEMPDIDFKMNDVMRSPSVRSFNRGINWDNSPKLGLSVQDSEDGKGVNVLDVDEDGNAAKAGIQEDDLITEVDGKAVNSADEIARVMKESKTKVSVKVKLQRKGKSETVEVKIPKKLKTADL